MKRILPFMFFLASGLNLFANPIIAPGIEFSELYFDNQGDWVIELSYHGMYPGVGINNIVLSSSTDSVVITDQSFNGSDGVFVYRKDSFPAPFHINRKGDSLSIKYSWHDYQERPGILIFGEYRGSQISSPGPGQSICNWNSYVKDNSPTIGALNDTTGIYGTLTGVVLDKYSMPVANRRFSLGTTIITSGNGSYSTRVLAQPATIHTLWYTVGEYTWKSVKIDTINFVMEPDSIVVRQIKLLADLETGLNDVAENNIFRLYPNPLNKTDQLYYEIDLPVKTAVCSLELLNVDGKLLLTKTIHESRGEIEMPPVNGLVLVNLRMDHKIIATSRILVNHE